MALHLERAKHEDRANRPQAVDRAADRLVALAGVGQNRAVGRECAPADLALTIAVGLGFRPDYGS